MASDERPSLIGPQGQTIHVDWVYEGAEQSEWMREREHWPEAMTPMELWIWSAGSPGGDRAWTEVALEAPPVFYRFQTLGPYLYANITEPPPARLGALAPRYIAVSQQYGGALRFWTSYCEPRIIQAAADLDAMDASADLRVAAETLFYGFHQTFTCLGLLFIPSLRLSALLKEFNVTEPELTANELLQGGENATQMIDERIWQLGELARANPVVLNALHSAGDAALAVLRAEPRASRFVAAFDALIAEHGRRSQGWMLTERTWAERPEDALALVRAQLNADPISPAQWRERTAARRKDAIERVLSALPPEKHEEFQAILDELEGYVPVREGRAYWQLVIAGAMRGLLLRVGDRLHREGLLNRPEDVLFLTPIDITAGSPDLRGRVADARNEWNHWRAFTPPDSIGTLPPSKEAPVDAERELRGSPASRGTETGIVRIIERPEDGVRLNEGDILVCVMTTPAWTPLFTVAGAIVTETGGALSHPAITAREYGIPAVVGLPGATTALRDGDAVTVDGTSGIVTMIA
jgi:phosphohistidine swiveling domain-containing protein